MSWVLLDDNFNNHPKAVEAGPVACWLFCCGLMYCRKHHTDGFIPKKAVPTLGVAVNPQRLSATLVQVGLWEDTTGGYRVHDYRVIYEDDAVTKADKERKLQQKREAGRRGGQASAQATAQARAVADAQTKDEQPARPFAQPHRTGTGLGSEDLVLLEGGVGETIEQPLDELARELVNLYPAKGRIGWNRVERPLYAVLTADPEMPAMEAWRALVTRLEGHKRSHQWVMKQMIPRLDRYLLDGLHLQELPEDLAPADQLTAKTNRTLSAASKVMRETA